MTVVSVAIDNVTVLETIRSCTHTCTVVEFSATEGFTVDDPTINDASVDDISVEVFTSESSGNHPITGYTIIRSLTIAYDSTVTCITV